MYANHYPGQTTYGDYNVDNDKDNLGDRSQDSQAPHLASSTTAAELHTIALARLRTAKTTVERSTLLMFQLSLRRGRRII